MAASESTPVPDFVFLYRRAFREFGAAVLWSSSPVPDPTPADALAITHSLRVEGNLSARLLAEQIEQACRAALKSKATFSGFWLHTAIRRAMWRGAPRSRPRDTGAVSGRRAWRFQLPRQNSAIDAGFDPGFTLTTTRREEFVYQRWPE